jgi:predicted lipoprotein with Yx(FWY)xxD motif
MKWILGLTLAGLGFGLTACGSGHPSATQTGGVGANQAAAPATVSVAQNPAQGTILVDGKGRTLYLFEKDNGTTSACTGACAQVWPALTAAAQPATAQPATAQPATAQPAAGSGVDASKLSTADGQVARQVTYAGHLLYSYSGDSAAGDVKGVGIPGWYPVSPSGAKVDKDEASPSTASTTTTSTSSSYGGY